MSRSGFITGRTRLEISCFHDYNIGIYWLKDEVSQHGPTIQGCRTWSISGDWRFYNNQVLVEIYRLVIFMPSEGKRKFYNNQLVVQRSMACVSDGQVYLSVYWDLAIMLDDN